MKVKLIFDDNNKLRKIKHIKEIFNICLKDAKDFVDSGVMISENCTQTQLDKLLKINQEIGIQVTVYNEPIEKDLLNSAKNAVWYNTECILLTKEEYEELKKYKALYQDLIGSLKTVLTDFETNRN